MVQEAYRAARSAASILAYCAQAKIAWLGGGACTGARFPWPGREALRLAGGWLGVGGLGVGGLGVGGLCGGVEWVSSRHHDLSRARALHAAESVGRWLRFRASLV